MNIILTAILPTVALLIVGNVLRRYDFLSTAFWSSSDKLTYFVLFPSLLITKVSTIDLATINFVHIFTFIGIYFAAISLLAYLLYRVSGASQKQFSSIYQGLLRFNSYIYFSIIAAVWGGHALATAALIAGVCIPIVNLCCIAAFSFGTGQFSVSSSIVSIVKNPLIIGSLLGFIANMCPVLLPPVVFDTFTILSSAALPLALLSVGASVRVKKLFVAQGAFSYTTLWGTVFSGLVVSPLIALATCSIIGFGVEMTHVLVVFAAVPTATSSFILAKQLGGDAELMVSIISLQTVISMVTLVFWLDYLIT